MLVGTLDSRPERNSRSGQSNFRKQVLDGRGDAARVGEEEGVLESIITVSENGNGPRAVYLTLAFSASAVSRPPEGCFTYDVDPFSFSIISRTVYQLVD